jgi:hypothetical protein
MARKEVERRRKTRTKENIEEQYVITKNLLKGERGKQLKRK